MHSNLQATLERLVSNQGSELMLFVSPLPGIIFLPYIAAKWSYRMCQTVSPLRILALHASATPNEVPAVLAMLRATKCRPRMFHLWRLLASLRRSAKAPAVGATRNGPPTLTVDRATCASPT
jgi:hypothetical protein